jgi:PAS domain S-box-containing protein
VSRGDIHPEDRERVLESIQQALPEGVCQETLEEAFRASQRLAAIVEWSDDAIVSKDLNGIITSWNRGAERIFGYSASEAIGRPITIIIPKDQLSEEDMVLSRIRAGQPVEIETVRRHKNGTPVDISLVVSPVTSPATSLAPRRSPGTSVPASGVKPNAPSSIAD